MNYIVLFLIFILFYAVNRSTETREGFDGIGKGFANFVAPRSCCNTKGCYPGMYLGNDFWEKNQQ